MYRYPVVPNARTSMAFSALFLVFTAGCNPQNATVKDATFSAFLSASTSPTYLNNQLGLNDDAGFIESDADFTPEAPYITPTGLEHYQIDCRVDVPDEQLLPKSGGNNPICNDEAWPPQNEVWATFDGYDVVKGPLEPWRGEAIITSEHDLQFTFHQDLPGGGDFRFMFVVDPSFAPSECRLNAEGQSERTPIDGDWLAEWAKDIPADSGAKTRFYLNAGSYQFNPADLTAIWILPDKWLAGFARAEFVGETFNARSVRYGKPSKYLSYETDSGRDPTVRDLYYVEMEPGIDPTTDAGFERKVAEVEKTVEDTTAELALLGQTYTPAMQTNAWRPVDAIQSGLDAWVELHYNYVDFDQSASELALGAPATGHFNLVFDATESQSKLFLQGDFIVEKVKKDPATVVNLQDEKQEEFGTELCGPAAAE